MSVQVSKDVAANGYHHFADRQTLLLELAIEGYSRLLDLLMGTPKRGLPNALLQWGGS
jgi:hypothetical protein